jgi:hypothetical protein
LAITAPFFSEKCFATFFQKRRSSALSLLLHLVVVSARDAAGAAAKTRP